MKKKEMKEESSRVPHNDKVDGLNKKWKVEWIRLDDTSGSGHQIANKFYGTTTLQ